MTKNITDNELFDKLKKLIVQKMQLSHPEIPSSISDWKGQAILSFQIELREKQNENISEKWFYTHMKSDNDKLPRIDTLNLLSRYAGYKNWDDFKFGNNRLSSTPPGTKDRSDRVFIVIPILVLAVLLVFYLAFSTIYNQDYTFCFYNNDTNEPIRDQVIELSVLYENETPSHYICDEMGCIKIKATDRILSFVVETPYYHTDTIVRTLNKFNRQEDIKVRPDDFALMIHYFSINNVEDWMKRRESLNDMFSDSAVIYQVMNKTLGMEVYDKRDFIEMLAMPTNSLRNIEIINTQYKKGKITHLKFKQSEADR